MIDTEKLLEIHLHLMKKKLLDSGFKQEELYPSFMMYFKNNPERYNLREWTVAHKAKEILSNTN